jgi:site-specific DNA-cytosine methylase
VQKPAEDSAEYERFCALEDPPPVVPAPPEESLVLVSTFDGIGGARRALELLGIKPALFLSSETDEECAEIVSREWTEVKDCGDITQLEVEEMKHMIDQHPGITQGLVSGGFPCQPFSSLNPSSGGFDDPRSDLFERLCELFEQLKEEMPSIEWHFQFENVASMYQTDRDRITQRVRQLCNQLPFWIDGSEFGWINRPRLYWTSWQVQGTRKGGEQSGEDEAFGYVEIVPPKFELPAVERFLDSTQESRSSAARTADSLLP